MGAASPRNSRPPAPTGSKARGEGHECAEVVILRDNASAVRALGIEQFAVEAFAMRLKIFARARQFLFHQRRHKRERINLTMRMRHGDADRDPGVFEDEHTGDIGISPELA